MESEGSATAGASCNSFAKGTLVLLANGKTKAIDKLKLGERVLAADPKTGVVSKGERVIHRFINHDDDLLNLTVHTKFGDRVIQTTDRHPFYDASRHAWTEAANLPTGDRLATASGDDVTVISSTTIPGSGIRYNLTVETLHTYYIFAGSVPILVHNATWACPTKNTHFADVAVHDEQGNVVDEYSLRSGNQTDEESAMGWPRSMIASHTENRVARMSGGPSLIGQTPIIDDPFAGLKPVKPGWTVVINGRRPPCSTCQGAMNRAADATGANFVYTWVNKMTSELNWWQAGNPLG